MTDETDDVPECGSEFREVELLRLLPDLAAAADATKDQAVRDRLLHGMDTTIRLASPPVVSIEARH